MILFLLLVVVFGILWYVRETKAARTRPPGPFQFPLVGSMLQVAATHPIGFIALNKLRKKYGDVISIRLGLVDFVFLSSYDSIKDLYGGEDCIYRPIAGIWAERQFYKNLGIIFSNGPTWQENRKFATQSARAHGFMNRSWLRNTLRSELFELVKYYDEEIQSSSDQVVSFDTSGPLKVSFTNLICAMLIGKRHEYSEKRLQDLVVALDKFFRASTLGISVMTAYPVLRFVLGKSLGYYQQLESVEGAHKYSRNIMKERRELGEYKKGEPTCFVDAFLQKMDETRNDPTSAYTEEQLMVIITDFFTAGAETTANWFLFAILLLSAHPEKQEKLYKEIQAVVGERPPEIEDKEKMVYTQAVMHEVHRWGKIAINLGPRETLKDVSYNGRTIKQGTTILANLYAVFNDKEYWGDPKVFRPERFIGEDGKLTKTERIIPFGIGKRVCLGEILARDSAFMYLTTMFQRYKFKLPEETAGKQPNLKLIEGITTCPETFKAKLVKRSS